MDLGGSFSVGAARREGVTPGLLRSSRWAAPYYGVRSPTEPVDTAARCRSYAAKMRTDAAFASVTAARLWGIPLPAHLEADLIHVSTPHTSPRVGGRGVAGSKHDDTWEVVTDAAGLRLFSPTSTWLSLGRVLGVPDLVAAGDYLVTAGFGSSEPPLTDLAQLRRALANGRRIGAPRLRAALELVRPGPLSRPESLTRVLALSAGVPMGVPNLRVSPLLMFDLAWPEWKVALDYHGAHHRTATQYARDLPRRELARQERWALIEIAKDDLFTNPFGFLGWLRSRLGERGAPLAPFHPHQLAHIAP